MTRTLIFSGISLFCVILIGLPMAANAQNTQPNLRKICRDHYNVTEITRAYIDSKGQLVCYIPFTQYGSAINHTSGGIKQNFNSKKKRKK